MKDKCSSLARARFAGMINKKAVADCSEVKIDLWCVWAVASLPLARLPGEVCILQKFFRA